MLKIIKTQLEGANGVWLEELPSVLWAYRTTGETPFQLAYGSEVVIPTEVGLTRYRVGTHDERKNNKTLRLQLDLLEKVRTIVEQRLA